MYRRTVLATLGAAMLASTALAGQAAASTSQPTATTHSPLAITEAGAATSPLKALVNVAIDPLGLLTRYSVQYGTDVTYGSSTPIKSLLSSALAGIFPVTLAHLAPSTVYHYRVVATNLLGTTYGADQTFATWPVQIPFLGKGVISKNNVESKPRGPRAGKTPIGWVMVIHGGGWQSVGREAMASEDSTVSYVTSLGWATDNVDYRKGEYSLPDVLAAYDALRKQVGSKTPICLLGHSAGGNLALLIAEHRSSADCVISGAGPTDLVHFTDQKAYTPSSPLAALYNPAWAFEQYMVTSFGIKAKILRRWSPADHAAAIHVPILLGASTHDPLVPQHQMSELRAAMKAQHSTGTIKTVRLAGTSTPSGQAPNFPHASITKRALTIWQRDERRLLAQAASAA